MNKTLTLPLIRLLAVVAVTAAMGIQSGTRIEAQGGLQITAPATNGIKFKAGLDYATDVLADPWDFNNREDVTLDPRQIDGFTNFTIAGGLAGGTTTTAALSGSNSDSHFYPLQRAYYNVVNTGRTGRRFPIDSATYTKLAFKMSSTGANQFPRVYWFHNDLGDPGGNAAGFLYTDPNTPAPTGNRVFVVDMTQVNQNNVNQGVPWTTGVVKGFGFYPNSGAIDYAVQFDWVRLTTADGHPASANMTISWTGGSGAVDATVTDSGGTVYTVKAGLDGRGGSFSWNYGILPPGTYTLKVGAATRTFTVNSPPIVKVTDPDETGGDDFATDVLHNPWDMNDVNDVFENVNIVNHVFNETFAGGVYTATSDGAVVCPASQCGVNIGDPQVYLLSNQKTSNSADIIDTVKYHRLTYDMTVDREFDLALGSIMRVFWGSDSSDNLPGGTPYNVTITKDIITWPGKNTYTIDLAQLTSAVDGGIEPGVAMPWTTKPVRHFRIDPHEFAGQIPFHMDHVKLAADDETKNGSFTIHWAGSDADNDAASVTLYYDTDQNPNNGKTLITSAPTLASGQYVWNTGGVPAGTYYIYAVVNDGLNADAQYSSGPLKVVNFTPVSKGFLSLNTPLANQVLTSAFEVGGWTLDQAAASGTGVDDIQFLVHPGSLSVPGVFIGHGRLNIPRPDVAGIFGAQFTNSGFHYTITGMGPGSYVLEVQARSTVTNQYSIVTTLPFSVSASALMSIDAPSAETFIGVNSFGVSGWAIDRSVESTGPSGTGIDQVHVYAYKDPGSGIPPVFLGIAQYGAISRPDVAGLYGSRYTNCGYVLNISRTASGLGPGTYNIVVWMHSSVSNQFIGNALVQVVLN